MSVNICLLDDHNTQYLHVIFLLYTKYVFFFNFLCKTLCDAKICETFVINTEIFMLFYEKFKNDVLFLEANEIMTVAKTILILTLFMSRIFILNFNNKLKRSFKISTRKHTPSIFY